MAGTARKAGRRPAGEGSIYQDRDGRWRGIADLGWVDGKRRRKYVRVATQGEVLAKLRQIRREADAGVVADERITVGQSLHIRSTDGLPEWWIDLDDQGFAAPENGKADTADRASQSDLSVWLTNRGPLDTIKVSGNRQLLDHWHQLRR